MSFQNCAKSMNLSEYTTTASTASCSLPASLTWTVGAATCAATTAIPTLPNYGELTVTANLPSAGNAVFTCTSGALAVAAGSTCDLSCVEPANFSWTIGTTTCTATGGLALTNGQPAVVQAAAPNSGSATFSCKDNQILAPTSATCTPPATPGCTEPANFSWTVGAATCTAAGGGSMANGQVLPVTATSPNTGSASFTCANQVVSAATNATCVASNLPPPPVITAPTVATTIGGCEGDPLTITGSATGAAPITYQWFKNAVALTGATAATYDDYFAQGLGQIFVLKATNAGGTTTSVNITVNGKSAVTKACGGGIQ